MTTCIVNVTIRCLVAMPTIVFVAKVNVTLVAVFIAAFLDVMIAVALVDVIGVDTWGSYVYGLSGHDA